ncbi:hypothetical protein ACIBQ6_21825 [Nonomuraea sp. NPDC049655]|uniref:hypothetical protein n=1 Tax=Nonomuraea sp. NPDC049655 TaxID=3364355 RepID=UPI0037A9674B
MLVDTLSQPTLTKEDAALLRARLHQDQQHLATVKTSRDDLAAQVASRDTVIDALEESITRAQRLLGEDGPLLPTAAAHRDLFGGPTAPLAGEVVPSPAREQLANGQPPDGQCRHCHQPVWRVGVSEASPTGLTHGFGATCDPNDPESRVAELAES